MGLKHWKLPPSIYCSGKTISLESQTTLTKNLIRIFISGDAGFSPPLGKTKCSDIISKLVMKKSGHFYGVVKKQDLVIVYAATSIIAFPKVSNVYLCGTVVLCCLDLATSGCRVRRKAESSPCTQGDKEWETSNSCVCRWTPPSSPSHTKILSAYRGLSPGAIFFFGFGHVWRSQIDVNLFPENPGRQTLVKITRLCAAHLQHWWRANKRLWDKDACFCC